MKKEENLAELDSLFFVREAESGEGFKRDNSHPFLLLLNNISDIKKHNNNVMGI